MFCNSNKSMIFQGEELSVECTAEHGQPLGQFLWKIGEDSEEENAVIWTNKEDPIVEVDEEGYFTSTQVLISSLQLILNFTFLVL